MGNETMKLLENVVYCTKHNMVFKNLLFGKPMAKGDSIRQLTIDEQVDYLYNKCCQPHSLWNNLAELCVAFPELQGALLRNSNHKNRDKIKSELKSSLSFPRHDMTGIKIGDRVRFLLSGLEAVILRIDEKDNSFQVIVRGIWYKFDLVELAEPVRTKLIPFQADKWTPAQKVVTRKEHKPVRILCVDAESGDLHYPVIGLIENRTQEAWTTIGSFSSGSIEHNHDLMVVVETKTKTLYGYWVLGFKGHIFGSEKERDECFDHFKDGCHVRIKFQTEIEL